MPSGQTLGSKQIAKLRKTYIATRNAKKTAKACRVSEHTIHKYKKAGKWDEIIKQAQAQAKNGMVKELAEKYAEDIKTINLAISLMVHDLVEHAKAKKSKPWNSRAYRDLIELRQSLLGEPLGADGIFGKLASELPDLVLIKLSSKGKSNADDSRD